MQKELIWVSSYCTRNSKQTVIPRLSVKFIIYITDLNISSAAEDQIITNGWFLPEWLVLLYTLQLIMENDLEWSDDSHIPWSSNQYENAE